MNCYRPAVPDVVHCLWPNENVRTHMKSEMFSRVFRVSAGLAALVAALLIGSRFFPPCGYAAVPFCWPGLLVLGGDETQERYGFWGELVLLWLMALPCVIVYAWLICRWRQHRRSTHDTA